MVDQVCCRYAVQYANDPTEAVTEFSRVAVPGGHVAVENWAERARNDLDDIEAAVARADGEPPRPDGELRLAGGLTELLDEAGLTVVASGLVDVPWAAGGDDDLVRAVLLGADPATVAELAPVVLAAARPFRTPAGGYRLVNAFRYAVARTAGARSAG